MTGYNVKKLRCFALFGALAANAQTSVLTYHNDNAHTGQYLNEILLSPANVSESHFGARQILLTDGPVYAQALYLSRVKIAGLSRVFAMSSTSLRPTTACMRMMPMPVRLARCGV